MNKTYHTILLFCLILFLAACSTQTKEQPVVEATKEMTSTATAEIVVENEGDTAVSEATITITDFDGREVDVPVNPQRIVALSEKDIDAAVTLGMPLVGVVNGRGSMVPPTYLADQLEGVASVGSFVEPSLETILALEPDLILIGGIFPGIADLVEPLSEIAPTVVTYGLEDTWQDSFLKSAAAMNRTVEAEAWLDTVYNQRVDAITTALADEAGSTVGIVRFNPDGPVIMALGSFASLIAQDLGLVRPEAQQIEGFSHGDTLSLEQIQDVDADYLFLASLNPEGAAMLEAAFVEPLYQSLTAVSEERTTIVDGAAWTSTGGPLAAMMVLEDIAAAYGIADEATAGSTAKEANNFPVTIEHKFGSTTIAAKPERVISVGYSEQDPILALGVTPIAIRDWFGEQPFGVWPWSQSALGDAKPTLMQMPFGELNFELITELDPDLIVATHSGITEDEYEFLSAIAPVLAQPAEFPDFGVPWQVQTQLIGQALGLSSEAADLIDGVEESIATTNEAYNGFGGTTVAWATPAGDGTFWIVGQDTPPMHFLARLGLVNDPTLQAIVGDSDSAQISQEQFDLLDVDLLIMRAPDAATRAALESDPLLSQLAVFQEDRVLFFEGNDPLYGALSFSTVSSLPYLLDELVPLIAAKLDTDSSARAEEIVVEHELGATTIAGVPERIVVLEYSFADHLAMLDVAPVGYAVDAMPDYLHPFTEGAGVEPVGTRAEPSLEAIVALHPDLIIGDLKRHEAIYDQLSAIAPTVIFNSLRGSYEDQIDTFVEIGKILDKEEMATSILDAYQETFAETAATTNVDAGDFMIGVLWADGFTAHSNQSFMGSFLESLGRTNALEPRDDETQYLLDIEGMATVNPSSIIVMCAPGDQAVLEDWQAHPVWQALDAVKNDRVYFFDRNLWSKGRGLMAFQTILEDAVNSGLLADAESNTTQVCP